MKPLKIGQLANQAGVTVRTLHHYDRIGLLRPSGRTASGHRLYTSENLARLHQILTLVQLGFSLREIERCLNDERLSLRQTVTLQLDRLREQIQVQERLCRRLERMLEGIRESKSLSLEDFSQVWEEMIMIDKYYTPEQLECLKQRERIVGRERIEQVQEEWKSLFDRFRSEMEQGTAPDDPRVIALAQRGLSLIREFTGGDAGIQASLSRMYRREGGPKVLNRHGYSLDDKLWEYYGKAMTAARQADGGA